MARNAEGMRPPVHDQISEMQRKIQLLGGVRTEYYESSQATMTKNRESILLLREENKMLQRSLARTLAGNQHVVKEAFHDRGSEKAAYRKMSGKVAVTVLDQKVLYKMKRLNALRHANQTCRDRIGDLKLQYMRLLNQEGSAKSSSTNHMADETEDSDRKQHFLENSLEKAQVKSHEAEHVTRGYIQLKNHLQDETVTFQVHLDRLEADILKHREELHGLQAINGVAQLSKDTAKAELQQQEDLLFKERKERERVVACYRRQVEERKAQTEKADRRAQKAPTQPEEVSSSEAHRSTARTAGSEEERSASALEEAFQLIKEAMGVTSIHEIVERYIAQQETQTHLESLKVENEEVLVQLKAEKEAQQQGFQDMKYSGEGKFSSDQQALGDCEQRVQEEQQRCDAAKERLDWLLRTQGTVQAAVEHLANKLQYTTLESGAEEAPPPAPDSEDSVVELLAMFEQKLQLLQNELQGQDLSVLAKEMEEDEFYTRIEGKLPDYNTRVQLPENQRQNPYNEDEESEEDEADIISREALKHQSQMIIDSKTKKKPRKKKKSPV